MRFLLFLFLILFTSSTHSFAQEIEYHNGNWESLMQQAKKKKKPFFVDFYTSWCGYCKKMDRTTFRDTAVTKFVKGNYIAYKLDAEKGEGPQFARKYGVSGYPTIIVFDHKGNKMGVIRGYRSGPAFLQELQKYKKQSHTKMVSDMSEDFTEYLKIKRQYIDELETKISKKADDKMKTFEDKALQHGKDRNDFEYRELRFDAQKFGQEAQVRVDMSYYLGQNNLQKYSEAVQKLLTLKSVSRDEKHYYILLLLENEMVDLRTLRAINSLALDKETFEILDTKAAVQLIYGDVEDAQDTGKRALKVGKKKKKDLSGTEILLDIIQKS